MGPRKGGRKTQEERDSEDSGPLLNCLLCSNTYHLHCIGGYRSRDRRPNFTNENFVCQMCKAEPPICTYCGAGFEPGQLAFRCDRCAGLGHDECLVREFDDAFDIMFDEELGVEEGTVGWFHRKWRCIDCTRWSDEIGQILTYRDVSVGELTMREYLVKYKNHSHRHNDWVGEKWLSNLEDGKAKYKLFWKKVEEENGRASKWGLPKLPWPKTEDEAVPDVW